MQIYNQSDRKVTWFIFEVNDSLQDISIVRGDLRPGGMAETRPASIVSTFSGAPEKHKFYALFTSPEAASGVPAHSPKGRTYYGGGNATAGDGKIFYQGTAGRYRVEAESGAWSQAYQASANK